MTFRFTYTIDDLREANAAVAKKGKAKASRGVFYWMLFVTLTAMLFLLLQQPRRPVRTGSINTPPPAIDPLLLLAPNFTVAALLLGFLTMTLTLTMLNSRNISTVEQQRHRANVAGGLFGFLMVALATFNIYVLTPGRQVIDWHPNATTELLASYVPWLVFFVYTIVFMVIFARTRVRAQRMKQKSFHRPKEMEFDAEQFIFRDDATEHHVRWASLLRYRETAALIIIHNEDGQMYLFPKRAFETPEQLMRFRGVIHTNIADGEFLPQQSAFPVSTPTAVLPATELPK